MKRGEFLRRSTAALVGIAIAPALISDAVEVLKPLPVQKTYWLKVTEEMLKDPLAFDYLIRTYLPAQGNVKEVAIGYMEDDFINNLRTMKIELE